MYKSGIEITWRL